MDPPLAFFLTGSGISVDQQINGKEKTLFI
jgi:hypothetical protein